jgi:hypothetical protein
MSVKGRKSRQWRHKFTHHGDTMEAMFERGRSAAREHVPARKTSRAVRARQLLADALAQAPMNPGGMEEETCTGCGLGQRAWLGNQGEGYVSGGERYCCQGCADRRECPCQG